MAGINFKAFDLGGHEIARKIWKDYYAQAGAQLLFNTVGSALLNLPSLFLLHSFDETFCSIYVLHGATSSKG